MSEGIGVSPGELQRRALSGVSWSTLSSALALPLAIGVSVLLARTLGPSDFARFAYLSFLVPFLIQAADLGFSQAATREASRAVAAGDLARGGELCGRVVGWNLLRLPVVLAAILALARPGLVEGALVVAFGVVATFGSGLVIALTAENRVATTAKLAFLQAVAAAGAGSGAALAGASGTTVWAVSFASGVAAAPGWLLTASPSLRRAAMTPRLPRTLPGGFWRFALVAAAASAGSILVFSRSEVVVLEALDQHRELAVFALAAGLAQRLTTPVDTLLGPLIPAMSALDAAHPARLTAGFERALRLSASGVAFVCSAALVGTALAAPLLFGPEYEGVGPAFVALALVSLLRAAAQPYTALAYAVGRPGVTLRALTIGLGVDLAVALATIPALGVWGAVLANAAGGATAVVLTARRSAGAGSLVRAGVPTLQLLILTLASCGLAYGAAVLAGRIHPGAGVAAAFVAGGAAFVLLGRTAGGVVPRRDAEAVLEVLAGRLPRVQRLARLLVSPAQ